MMTSVSRFLRRGVAAAALALSAAAAWAAPITVSVTGFTISPGTGYGVDRDERQNQGATLLGASFTSNFLAQDFALTNAGDFMTFSVASVHFFEPANQGHILASEIDNLGVSALFSFTNPLGTTLDVAATGAAEAGSISDSGLNVLPDLTITWKAIQIAFGNGGLLELTLNTLAFTAENQALTQFATVTLLSAQTTSDLPAPNLPAPALDVPEPGSLLLAGLALAAVGATTRRRPAR